MYFDDEGAPSIEAVGAAGRSTDLNDNPERQALAALEFDARARELVTRAIAFGQTRASFMKSIGDYWNNVAAQFSGMVRKLSMAIPTAPADAATPAGATTSTCEHVGCPVEGPHEHVTGGPVDAKAFDAKEPG